MKTLILCVDRDNDLGEKARIKTPIVGREFVLNAGISLLLADPEDSDGNSLFQAVKEYDELKKKGEDVEIAAIAGDKNVGGVSDLIISEQLDTVLKATNPDNAIFISDGAEDEFILPIILSRIKIRMVKRVVVRQEKNIESLYYIIIRALKEEKFLKKVLAPLGVAFLVLGVSMLLIFILRIVYFGLGSLDPATAGFISVTTAIGVYFLVKAYSVGKHLSKAWEMLEEQFMNTRITVFSGLIGISIIIYGIYIGFQAAFTQTIVYEAILYLLYKFVPFFIIGIIVYDIGRIMESLRIFKEEEKKKYLLRYAFSALFSVSFAVAIMGLLTLIGLGVFKIQFGNTIIYALALFGGGILGGALVSVARRKLLPDEMDSGEAKSSQANS
jgi:Predicted membrane protein